MSMTSDKNDQADVERLLALAGPRDAVPAERLERMRAAVHDAWTAKTTEASGAGNGWFLWTLVTAAAAAAVVITVVRTLPDGGVAKPAEAPAVAAAVHITTGPAERKSLLLPRGGELRVDASSVVTIAEGGEIHISKGALYLDSKGTTLPAVITPAGRITDIGTRFEVRIISSGGVAAAAVLNTRVRVRDGKVRLAHAVMRAPSVKSPPPRSCWRARMRQRRAATSDPFGAEWAWVARAAPRFELEGKSLGSFLDWIEKEGGWTVAFASPALERRARSTVLHGSVESMSTTEALEAILPSCGLVHRVDLKTGRVTVAAEGRENDERAPRDPARGRAGRCASYAGKPLGDVLRDLQRRGLNVVFSSELVKPDMKVAAEPKATTPRKILDEVLAPHGLAVRSGPRESFVVVRATRAPEAPVEPGAGRRAVPPRRLSTACCRVS